MGKELHSMKTIPYACKICGKPGQASYDDSEIPLDLDKWVSMLTCNRCYDYRSRRIALADDIWRTCYDYSVSRSLNDGDKRSEAVKRAREALNRKTKLFAGIVCAHRGRMTMWEPDFTQMLLDEPLKCSNVLNDYERRVAALQ